MSKRLLLLSLLLTATLLLGGCQRENGTDQTGQAAGMSLPDAPLTTLYFCERASYYERVQGYEFRVEDGRQTACFHMANEDEPYCVPVDQAWVDTLTGYISQYGMMAWDGFSGSAPDLLDGTHFEAAFAFADGTAVRASGYGTFPENYGDAASAMDEHFIHLLPEDMRDW